MHGVTKSLLNFTAFVDQILNDFNQPHLIAINRGQTGDVFRSCDTVYMKHARCPHT